MKKIGMILTIFFLFLLLTGCALAHVFSRFGDAPGKERERAKASHFRQGRFANTETGVFLSPQFRKKRWGLLRFLFASPNAPGEKIPLVPLTGEVFAEKSSFSLMWLGHSSMIFELDHLRFAADPVFGTAAPVSFAVPRYTPPPFPREQLPELDFVLLSHDHYDHAEYDTIRYLKDRVPLFVVPLGVAARLRSWGVPPEKIRELDWEESTEIGPVRITLTESRHFSGRTLSDRNTTLWGSYVIRGKKRKIFFGGDSAYGKHFRTIGEKYGPFDLVCLECDAWNLNWKNNHSFPHEVPLEFHDLKGRRLLPMHWGVFDLAGHPWKESVSMVAEEAKKHSIPLLTPKMGEKIDPLSVKTRFWWENVK